MRREEPTNAPRRGLGRHLAGWQLGVLTVGIVLLAALIAVPRPVAPDVLPVPNIERRQIARELSAQAARADRAERHELPFDVRAVGEAFHRYGAANYAGDGDGMDRELGKLRSAARIALQRYGSAPLLELCAIQTRLFVRALSHWEDTGQVDAELKELGGNFADKATRSSWMVPARGLMMDPTERRVLFRIRWAGLTGLLTHDAFAPSLNDWRVYYRFLLEHPEAPVNSTNAPSSREEAIEQLAYVKALVERDPYYPAALARGVLAYRLEHFDEATREFRAFLIADANGPWRLRAQNYLLAALVGARTQPSAVLNSPSP
jgi:hypothetical protein